MLLWVTPAPGAGVDGLRQPGRRLPGQFPGRAEGHDHDYTSEYGADSAGARLQRRTRPGALFHDGRRLPPIEKMLTEKAKKCPPFADERCTGFGAGAIVGAGYWRTDIRGALVWASWQFMQRDAKVTHYMWNFIDLVEGHQLQLTNNTRQVAHVRRHLHAREPAVHLEGTVPDGDPEPGLFQQSLGFVDKDGNGIRYRDYYDNDYPPPSRAGRGARCGACAPAQLRRRCAMTVTRHLASGLRSVVRVPGALPAGAHHSHGNYADTFIDLEGVVKEVHLVTPHSWVYIEVKDASGQPQTWALEATSAIAPAAHRRDARLPQGWRHGQSALPSAARRLTRLPARFLKAPDGTIKDWDGNNLPIPTDF